MEKVNKFERPWGYYCNTYEENGFKIKKIVVYPGSRLSLQSHKQRSEHWVVVDGKALVTVGDKQIEMSKDQYVYIPLQAVHRLQNIGEKDLVLVEVQLGPYLGEDDIIRYEDDYNRVSK